MKVNLYKPLLPIFIGITLLAGCAVKQPISLSPQATKSIDAVQTILYVPQNNIDIDVKAGNPGNTGLLGALIVAAIDDARRTKAQKAQAGLSDAVSDFDFRSRMAKQLSAELARVQTVNLQSPVQLETTDSPSLRQVAYDRSKSSAVLFVNVSYKVIDGTLLVTANCLMYPKSSALMPLRNAPNENDKLDQGNSIFRKNFTFTQQAVDSNNIRESLLHGIASVAWQLAVDLNHVGATSNSSEELTAPLAISLDQTVNTIESWQGSMSCEAREDTGRDSGAYQAKFAMEVRGNTVAVHRKTAAVTETLSGKVTDNVLELSGTGYRINDPSRKWQFLIKGDFQPGATAYSGKGNMLSNGKAIRACELKMIRSSIPAL